MVTFQETENDIRRIVRRIRRVLEARHAVHINEVRQRVSMEGKTMDAALETMMAQGEIERLRPVDYSSDIFDYFRLNKPAVPRRTRRAVGLSDEKIEVHKYIHLAGESIARQVG